MTTMEGTGTMIRFESAIQRLQQEHDWFARNWKSEGGADMVLQQQVRYAERILEWWASDESVRAGQSHYAYISATMLEDLCDELKAARLRFASKTDLGTSIQDVPLVTLTTVELFDRLISPYEETERWNSGLAALQLSAVWMERGLLDLCGVDGAAERIVVNSFGGVKRRFEQLYDIATNWHGEEQ